MEEPLILARVEPLLKGSANGLLGLLALRRLLEAVGGDGGLEVRVKGVSRGHHVVVVHDLDEGLDLWHRALALCPFLLL